MDFHIKTILLVILTCALTLGVIKIAKADYPNCPLYKDYRCVPAYGNKVICGCGL